MAFWDKQTGKTIQAESETKVDSKIDDLRAQIKTLQNQADMLDRQNSAYKYLENDLRTSLKILQDEYAAIKPRYDVYVNRYGELAENASLPALPVTEDADNELTKARLQITALSTRCLELEHQIQKQNIPEENKSNPDDILRIQQLEAQMKAYVRELEKNEVELKQIQTKYNNARGELQQKNQMLATAKDIMAKFRAQVEKQANAEQNKTVDMTALKRRDEQIADLTSQVSQLMSENTDLLSEKQNLKAEIADTIATLSKLTAETKQTANELYNTKQELQTAKDEMTILFAEKSELLTKTKNQSAEISELTDKIAQLEKRNAELQKYEQMAQSISSLMGSMNK
ncbi:hypothetical protein J6A31_04855 [bacterium]|nr:hypothetical protein [bacterium]